MSEVRIRRDALPDHPWIYRKQVLRPDPGTRNGDPVRILGRGGKPLGAGLYNGKSQIALRVLVRDPKRTVDEAFVTERVRQAVELRRRVLRLDERTNAYRLVNSEGDGLSGLVVDRYADVLSVQVRCLGMFRLMPAVASALLDLLPGATLVYRRDTAAERIEGFRVPEPAGEHEVEIETDGLRMRVDPVRGHKTGAFLDQRDNRRLAASVARGRRVLDLFCYEGAFALACDRAGARSVDAVDLDEAAVARGKRNAKRLGARVAFRHGDAFEVLRRRPETDFVLLDPPRWISGREDEAAGRQRYLDLNGLAIGVLSPGGLLATSSCSGRLPEEGFLTILRQAAGRAGRDLRILAVRGAAPDHPLAANFPEGRYLKFVLAEVR